RARGDRRWRFRTSPARDGLPESWSARAARHSGDQYPRCRPPRADGNANNSRANKTGPARPARRFPHRDYTAGRQLHLDILGLGHHGEDANVLEGPQLVVDDVPVRKRGLSLRVIVILIELGEREGERVTRPRVVALDTFGPAGVMPRLFAPASRCFPIGNRECAIHAGRGDERGVRLLLVPGVTISPPAPAVE